MSRQSLSFALLGVALVGLAGPLAGCAADQPANPQLSAAAVGGDIDVPPDLVPDDDGRSPGLEGAAL